MERLRLRRPNRNDKPLPFYVVNRRDRAGFNPYLQRHHLLPIQLLRKDCFGPLFDTIGRKTVGFDDFRRNGLLLPCKEDTAIRLCLPMHRGPHPTYNDLVMERVGQIERDWSATRPASPDRAMEDALYRLALLQKALRKRLLAEKRHIKLNRKDPLGTGFDFSELDAMAEQLWEHT